jgi:hypothetical protein
MEKFKLWYFIKILFEKLDSNVVDNDNKLYTLYNNLLNIFTPIINTKGFHKYIKSIILKYNNCDYKYIKNLYDRLSDNNKKDCYKYIQNMDVLILIIKEYKININLDNNSDIINIMFHHLNLNDIQKLYHHIINNYDIGINHINILTNSIFEIIKTKNMHSFIDPDVMTNIINMMYDKKFEIIKK